MTFSELDLTAPILRAAREAGYTEPSPIQRAAIPPVLAGRDVLGCAQTGTGKTAAFAMPILQRLAAAPPPRGKRPIRALVLTPTRELALQIDESFAAYGRYLPLRCRVIFGGVGQAPQVEALRAGVDILTATPGRLNDLIGQGHIDLGKLEIFVLDEADRMLDMGFVHDVERVIRHLPAKRQTLLFSATMPAEIERLAASLLKAPQKVMVAPPATTVEAVEQSVCLIDKGNKRHLLAERLRSPDVTSALVFTRTKHGADRVVRELSRVGIGAMAIHGNKSQNARQDALAKFKDGRVRVLVATDIAARGIDVQGISHVFNYDLPNIPETYVHRIGRTARAGRAGVAVSFCDAGEREYLADIEKLTRTHIPRMEHAWPMQQPVEPPAPPQPRARGKKGSAQPVPPQSHAHEKTGSAQPAPLISEHSPAPRAEEYTKKTAGRTTPPKEETRVEQATDARRAAAESAAQNETKHRRNGKRRGKLAGSTVQAAVAAVEAAETAGEPRPAQPQNRAPQPKAPKTPAAQGGAPKQSRPARQERAKQRAPEKKGAEPARSAPEAARRTRAPEKAPAPAPKNAKQPKPDCPKKQANRPAAPKPPQTERDDSIQLIARRAPAQKYASFEEYMKAHGQGDT